MSAGGRGRGYLGRHHLRDEPVRPGDPATSIGDKTTPSVDKDINSGDKSTHSGERITHAGDKIPKSATPRSVDKGREKSTCASDKSAVLNKTHQSVERSNSRDMTTHSGDKSTRIVDRSARSVEKSNALSEEVQCSEPPKDVHHSSGVGVADTNSRTVAEAEEETRLGADDEAALAELMRVEEVHRPLVAMLEQFSPGEDGIAFNRKLREFEATLTALCSDDTQLQLAFASLRGAALGSAALARKLASVGASFTRQQRQNVLRMALLNVMQSTFAKLDVLERASPHILTNAATLMGDYFMEARLGNGSKVQLLCAPLLQYLRSLLACADRRAHRALATQLMQNGRELLASNGPELEELSVSVRIRLLSAPPACLIWLLLSADLCINKFLPLPAGLQGFYASNLELVPEADTYSEVTYGSWRRADRDAEGELSPANLSEESARKPRPILGAGAALTRQTNSSFPEVTAAHDTQDVWNKSALAKRYDLNSWRQHDADEKDESQEEFPSADKFIPSQQFVPNDVSGQWSAPPGPPGPPAPAAPPAHYAKFNPFTTPPPFVPERSVAAAPVPVPVAVAVPNEKFSNPPPFLPERYDKQPFPGGERRPPENWRREREEQRKVEWSRQKSEEPVENGEAESRVGRDGSGDARRQRESRPRPPRRDSDEKAPAPAPAPPRRPEKRMDVPRSRKYWDHDDRLDKDYNS